MTKKDIFQIKDLYAYYHKITWIYKNSQKRNKKIYYAVNILSVLLASTGVISGGITLKPTVLSVLTTAGILLKSYHEFKNKKDETDLLKLSATSYLTNLREAMRGKFWIKTSLIYHLPPLNLSKTYSKKFTSR